MTKPSGKTPYFGVEFDFEQVASPDFREDSVREELVLPFLRALGFGSGQNRIIRSRPLTHPFVQLGTSKRHIESVPDYLLQVSGKLAWVLDAKAPKENILSGRNVEQTFFYAIHPDVRVPIYSLCNGRDLTVFNVSDKTPLLSIPVAALEEHWDELLELLAPEAFKGFSTPTAVRGASAPDSDFYAKVTPPEEIRSLHKQTAKRHFGAHPYFTKQPWDVVQQYIRSFTLRDAVVLDPFGGSGVTAIEAAVLGRTGIHVDINPLANFIVSTLIEPVDLDRLAKEFKKIVTRFKRDEPKTKPQVDKALATYQHPTGIRLPKSSDVEFIEELFSPDQLARLAFLKHLIMQVADKSVRRTLLLMFSGLLNKINLTYHASGVRSEGRGDSAVFRYYRYRLAPKPAKLDLMVYFQSRLTKVIAAKKEVSLLVRPELLKKLKVYHGSATDLAFIDDQSVDYIYTDPPYGSKIQYLDLSVMWTAWLDLPVTKKDFKLEAIEGGELNKTKSNYRDLLTQSIAEMFRVLKYDRWLSFVFAHKDPAYWHLIVDAAEKAGFEYMGAVKQATGKVTFKKHQNPFTVLNGQLIITFKKVNNPRSILKVELGADISEIVIQTVEGVIAAQDGATIEEINDELIIKGLELGFLDVLSREYKDPTPLLMSEFAFNEETHKFHLKPDQKFRTHLDTRIRIKYYLLSYLRRMKHQKRESTFEDIVLNIMPLLKNGITPRRQTILSVLEQIAEHAGHDRWRLSDKAEELHLLPETAGMRVSDDSDAGDKVKRPARMAKKKEKTGQIEFLDDD